MQHATMSLRTSSTAILKKTVLSTAVFTIAPAVAIVISVITLAKDLGVALPDQGQLRDTRGRGDIRRRVYGG